MTGKLIKITGTALLLVAISLGTTSCSNTPTPDNTTPAPTKSEPVPIPTSIEGVSYNVADQTDGSYIIGPVTGSMSDLIKAKKVKVPAGSSLIIYQMDTAEYPQWTATSSNEKVAVFAPGTDSTSSPTGGTPPTFNVLSSGTSDIVMKNSATKQTVKFTIEGILNR